MEWHLAIAERGLQNKDNIMLKQGPDQGHFSDRGVVGHDVNGIRLYAVLHGSEYIKSTREWGTLDRSSHQDTNGAGVIPIGPAACE